MQNKIEHIFEPTPLQCGQAVLSMLTGKTVDEIITVCGTDRETTLKQMFDTLSFYKVEFFKERKEAKTKEQLPSVALLSLETPRCWHWSLYFSGTFYDPEHGILDDFPTCNRKYYWEIKV